LAKQEDITSIPAIPRRLPTSITVKQIRQIVLQHLQLPTNGTNLSVPTAYCNCSFARAIHAETTLKKGDWASEANSGTEHPFLFVNYAGEVSKLTATSTDNDTLIAKTLSFAQETFGNDVENVMLFNVVRSPNHQTSPIVTLCSRSRHGAGAVLGATSLGTTMRLDLHTAEAPITTPLSDLTMAEMGLEDVLIDGVLNIYALARKDAPSATTSQGTSLGMAAIFEDAPHWQPDVEQSERGRALFLSTLRVVCNIAGRRNGKSQMQDAILRLLHALTGYPPAVRAMHILLRGETPSASECATISQTMFHLLDKYAPMRVINFDKSRLFEASRLFFGLMLEKAKHLCRANPDDASLPYLTSMKSVDLLDSETTNPLVFPVDTNVGLLERGHLKALKSGLVKFSDPSMDTTPTELVLDGRTRRAALLTGGLSPKVSVFDMDILFSSPGFHPVNRNHQIITSTELDLSHLAVICSRNGLTVVAPSRLGNSAADVLTLDGDGLGTVYLGRAGCGPPGRDFEIYRPTRGGDTHIDPAIVTQLLAPILAARQADGSAVFDAPGDVTQRKIETPDEILMVCVDCSASMGSSVGFADMVEDEPEPPQAPRTLLEQHNLIDELVTMASPLDEVKEWLGAHESFDDVVHTVKQVCNVKQATVSKRLLVVMAELAGKELKEKSKKLVNTGRFTYAYRHNPAQDTTRLRVESLKKFIIGVHQHQAALIDWIVFRSRMLSDEQDNWEWHLGNPLPGNSLAPAAYASDTLNLSIPDDFQCAITYEIMADPVSTADGHVYDRPAIDQWLRINNTSPKTGLQLANTRLTAQRRTLRDINDWVSGNAFRGSSPSRSRINITFSSRLGAFERSVKASTTCSDLYHLVFQALRGRHSTFELKIQGRIAQIEPSTDAASEKGVRNGCTINIALPDTNTTGSSSINTSMGHVSDKGLIKVYGNTKHLLFTYWVSKTTNVSMGSVLFKYWRKVVLPWGIAGLMSSLRTWTNMTDSGDGHSRGWIRKPYDKLSTYLTAVYAKGNFEEEDVFDKPKGQYNGILKVYISTKPPKNARLRTSRMDVLKQMFDQFVNRIIAYGYNTHIGLITFSTTATVARPLTGKFGGANHISHSQQLLFVLIVGIRTLRVAL
jgi:predicted transcriptional regulator